MYLLIEVGGYIGTLPTIALVMLTAVIGVALLRRQGLATLTRGMGRLQRGEIPAEEMAEGILLAISGALLLTPGFVTDAVGFTFLLPATRILIAQRLLSRVSIIGPGGVGPGGVGPGGIGRNNSMGPGPTIIEGEFDPHPEDKSDCNPRR